MNQGIKFYKTYDVKKISECHQTIGPKTLAPNSRLDRWSGVHNAISDWMINDADDEVAGVQERQHLWRDKVDFLCLIGVISLSLSLDFFSSPPLQCTKGRANSNMLCLVIS